MTLGRGLESLIPPINPFKKSQDDLKSDSHEPEADISRTEPLTVPFSLVSPPSSGEQTEREEGLRPLETENPSSDREVSAGGDVNRGVVFQIETDKIKPNPHQPRRDFDEASLKELADSIREFGIIQPLIVSKIEKESDRGWEVNYELVAGERRLMAAKMLGLRTVPAIIRQVPAEHEKLELAVTENVQRTNLNPIEFARAIAKLQEDFRLTQREVAARLGKSREAVANTLRLLSLPTEIQEAVAKGNVSESQARLLLSVEDPAQRDRLFREILTDNLTVREINLKVRQLKGKPISEDTPSEPSSAPSKTVDPELLSLKEELEAALGAPVEIRKEGQGGKLTINFYSKEELEGILAKIKQNDSQSL